MYRNLYEYEICNKIKYDGIREYCKAEHMNEEHFRAFMHKSGWKHKVPIKKLVLTVLNIFTVLGIRE